jgi:hypothetical protein
VLAGKTIEACLNADERVSGDMHIPCRRTWCLELKAYQGGIVILMRQI